MSGAGPNPADRADAAIREGRLVAIVRLSSITPQRAASLARMLVEAGIRALEFTMDTNGAASGIQAAIDEVGDRAVVGAGTVLTTDDVDLAARSGASFVVSPNVDLAVIECALDQSLQAIPGVYTATEALAAAGAGATMVKLFPAVPGGPAYLRALSGPLRKIAFVPTGGIAIDEVASFLAAGATAVGLGSCLVAEGIDDEEVARRATAAVAASRSKAE